MLNIDFFIFMYDTEQPLLSVFLTKNRDKVLYKFNVVLCCSVCPHVYNFFSGLKPYDTSPKRKLNETKLTL